MKEVKSWKGHDAVCSPARIRLRLYKDHSQSYIDAKVYGRQGWIEETKREEDLNILLSYTHWYIMTNDLSSSMTVMNSYFNGYYIN